MNIEKNLQTETNPIEIHTLIRSLATKESNDKFVVEYLLSNYLKLDTFTVARICSTFTMDRQNLSPILKEKIKVVLNDILKKEFTVHQYYKEKWHKDNYTESSIKYNIQSAFDNLKGYRLLEKAQKFNNTMILGDCFSGVVFKKIVDIISNDLGYTLIKVVDLITDGVLFTFKKDSFTFDLGYDSYCEIHMFYEFREKASHLKVIANDVLKLLKEFMVKKLDNADVIMISEKGRYGHIGIADSDGSVEVRYLAICKYVNDSKFYLFYLDENKNVKQNQSFNDFDSAFAETQKRSNTIEWLYP